jgi:adenylate cyclase
VDTQPEAIAASVERQLWGEPTLTARDVARRSDLPLEFLLESRRALGISTVDPDDRAFDENDLESLKRTKLLLDAGVAPETLLAVARVLGAGMARYSEAVRDMFAEAFVSDDDDPQEAAYRLAQMGEQLLPAGIENLGYVFALHLREVLRHDVARITDRARGGGRMVDVAIGFADIVGYSALGEKLAGDEMGEIAERLATKAQRIVSAPVRLVKTIGDGVMLASTDPAPLLDVLLELAETEGDDPPVRGGLAYGPALHRMGDYYGHTVNVASRVAERARPGSVLATPEVRETAGSERYEWSNAGAKALKGVGTLAVYRARRRTA